MVKEYKEILPFLMEKTIDCGECPICDKKVPFKELSEHTNQCLDGSLTSSKKKFKSFIEMEYPIKMIKPVYNLLKDQDLRRILGENKLDTKGDRELMIWRHQEYLLLCNSEFDSTTPKDLHTIRSMVRENESRRYPPPLTKGTVNTPTTPSPQRYIKDNQFHFKELIMAAKTKKYNKQ